MSGGSPSQPGPHGDRYASPNVIQFPAPSLPVNSELRSRAPLFIQDDSDHAVLCALAIILTSAAISIGCLLYAGKLIFGLFDLG